MDLVAMGEFGVLRRLTVPSIPRGGGTVTVTGEVVDLYGSPLFLAIALSRLGLSASVIGPLGNDPESAMLQATLAEAGVDASNLVTKRGRIAERIAVTDGNETLTFIHPGTSDELQLGDVNLSTVEGSKYVYLGAASGDKQLWLQKQLVSGLKETRLVLDLREHHGRGLEEIRALLQRCEIVFGDEAVLEDMTGEAYPRSCTSLLDEGCRMVAVFLHGSDGSLLDRNGEHLARMATEVGGPHSYEAFMAGVLFGLHRDEAPDMCIELGCRAADLHATSDDGAFPTREELLSAMAAPPSGVNDVDFVAEP
ncbi:MAG TPA: carbohydrate kinase family protein [Thermoplasmata archaeon]|nr:carbohydrate kinase family protein [Thermoplasmata archaeon]